MLTIEVDKENFYVVDFVGVDVEVNCWGAVSSSDESVARSCRVVTKVSESCIE